MFEVANLIGIASQRQRDKSNYERKPRQRDHRCISFVGSGGREGRHPAM
jgi:hypothetical protein